MKTKGRGLWGPRGWKSGLHRDEETGIHLLKFISKPSSTAEKRNRIMFDEKKQKLSELAFSFKAKIGENESQQKNKEKPE